MLRTSPLLRQLASAGTRPATRTSISRPCAVAQTKQQQVRQQHAISNPTLANIEKRWDAMPPQEQADLWMALRDRMKVDWNELTMQEKKAAYWIAFGPHGPRAEAPPGENTKMWTYTFIGVAVGSVLFYITHVFARGPPPTMTKEWQEKTNEYFQEKRMEPITGAGQEGYKGSGQIQSPPEAQAHTQKFAE